LIPVGITGAGWPTKVIRAEHKLTCAENDLSRQSLNLLETRL